MSDKILNNVQLNVKWKVSTSSDRPGGNAGTDGYVNENITDTLGKVVKYLNDLDSNKLDTSTVSTTGSYGAQGWSECKLVNGKIKYYYTINTDTNVKTSEDNSDKLYLTGAKRTGNYTDQLWKNTSVYEQAGVICAPEVNTASLVLNDSRPKNLLRYKPRKYSANGMTFVENDDGSITVSGTATARTVYILNTGKSIIPGAGTYVLSSGGISTSSDTYWVELYIEYDSGDYRYYQTYSDSTYVQFTVSTSNTIKYVAAYIIIASGKTCNQTFRPMLCTLDDWNKSTTFYPPAVSINELYRTTQTVSSLYPIAMYGEGAGGLNIQPVNTTWCGSIRSDSNRFPSAYAISRMYPLDETGSSRFHIIELLNGGKLTRYYDGSRGWSEYQLIPYVQQYVRRDVTTSTSLSDTGASVTLQEIGTYRITGSVVFINSEPSEVALYVGSNRIAYATGTSVTDSVLTASGFVRATSRNSLTVDLYVKTTSSASNHVTLMAEHVSLDY